KVKRKVGEIAGVTDEVVTEPTGGDEPRDPDGVKGFQPGQSYRAADQRDVCCRGRGHVTGAPAHHLNAVVDDIGSHALPPAPNDADVLVTVPSFAPPLVHGHAAPIRSPHHM